MTQVKHLISKGSGDLTCIIKLFTADTRAPVAPCPETEAPFYFIHISQSYVDCSGDEISVCQMLVHLGGDRERRGMLVEKVKGRRGLQVFG